MTKNNEKLNIVFAIDEKYLAPLAVALESLCETNIPGDFNVVVIHSGLTKKSQKILIQSFRKKGLSVRCEYIEDEFLGYDVGFHFNSVIFYRLVADKFFPDGEKFLYCDADVIFLDSLIDLASISMEGKVLAAVHAHNENKEKIIPEHMICWVKRYFPSCFLLVDAGMYRSKGVLEKCKEFLASEYYFMPDQDALNFALNDDWHELPFRYVVTKKTFDSVSNPVAFQFMGSSKPWLASTDEPDEMVEKFWKLARKNPYWLARLVKLRFAHLLKRLAGKLKKVIGVPH